MEHYDLHTVCHLGGINHSLPLAALRVSEVGEALIQSVGNGHCMAERRVKWRNCRGPSGGGQERAVLARFLCLLSLRRQRK